MGYISALRDAHLGHEGGRQGFVERDVRQGCCQQLPVALLPRGMQLAQGLDELGIPRHLCNMIIIITKIIIINTIILPIIYLLYAFFLPDIF